MREGSEPEIFWDTLGGKAEYPRGKEIPKYIEDPHLFVLDVTGGKKNTLVEKYNLLLTWFRIIMDEMTGKACLIDGSVSYTN